MQRFHVKAGVGDVVTGAATVVTLGGADDELQLRDTGVGAERITSALPGTAVALALQRQRLEATDVMALLLLLFPYVSAASARLLPVGSSAASSGQRRAMLLLLSLSLWTSRVATVVIA